MLFVPQNQILIVDSSEKEETIDLIINYLKESINQIVAVEGKLVFCLNLKNERSFNYLKAQSCEIQDGFIHPENIFLGEG